MENYTFAWLIVALMALAGGATLWFMLRRIGSWMVKLPIVVATVLLFATPAPIPGYASDYAPAFVVAIFEAFFQINGQAETAVLILCSSVLLGIIGAAALGYFLQRAK